MRFDLKKETDAIVVIDPRDDLQGKAFGMDEIEDYRKQNPKVKVLHRVNECDQRKGTDFIDALLARANKSADFTVFISDWLKTYHRDRWFSPASPNAVIYNGADAKIFHPIGGRLVRSGEPVRIVTHHWSDNPLKGFDIYERVDQMIADGLLPGFELWIIGRWPREIKWRSARTFPPCEGRVLANLLRKCHLYLTASRWEPCGMHHIEGAQCGLPLIYHEDGGGIVEAGKKYGLGFRDDIGAVLRAGRDQFIELRNSLLDSLPCGEQMVLDYANIIQRLIANAKVNAEKSEAQAERTLLNSAA